MLTTDDTSSLFEAFGAFLDGRMVGEGILMGSHRDNLHMARLLLWVAPSHQGHGYGGSLLAFMEDHARASGRTLLRSRARIGEGLSRNRSFAERLSRNRSFAERHGYTLTMTEIERRRSLPVDPTLLDRLVAESAPHHTDYEIGAFVGTAPAALRASYVDLRNLLEIEAPHGDLELESGRNTLEDLDAMEREHEEAGRTAVVGYAVRDGVMAAYADASVPGGDVTHVDQYGTLVHPEHRGHRLGMAVKCAQLRLLSEQFPERTYIQTSNAEVNAHMVAINVVLGFTIHQVWGEFEKRLA
jgi:GNAT superfamily N-acetyltransferase